MNIKVITVDGPASSGKSSVSKEISKILGYVYFNTGLVYRAIGFLKAKNIDFFEAIKENRLFFELLIGQTKVIFENEDITQELTKEYIGALASEVAKEPSLREKVIVFQRSLVKKNAVVEGRDAGTHIFKDATIKFFIDADPKERALRRYLEEKSSYEDILNAILKRDETDKNRKDYPFRPAEDAIKIDSTCMTKEEVINLCMNYIKKVL